MWGVLSGKLEQLEDQFGRLKNTVNHTNIRVNIPVQWPEFLPYESIEIRTAKVTNAIKQMGFEPADYCGLAGNYGETVYGDSYIGLLDNSSSSVEMRRGLFSRKSSIRRDFIGVLWFDPVADRPWYIEVFHRSNMTRLQILADELTRAYKKSVKLILKKETTGQEQLPSDFDF